MNESPTRTLDDEENNAAVTASLEPAPLIKRMIAFAMDFILIVLLLQLLAHFMPTFWDAHTQDEFKNLLHQATLLPKDDQMNSEEMARFIQESGLSHETYEMLMAMVVWACFLPILYFFIGERFFSGQSLGKATFGLKKYSFRKPGIAPYCFPPIFPGFVQGIECTHSHHSFFTSWINELSFLLS